MGVAIGSDVQAYDAQLADVAGLAVSDGNIIVGDGSNFVAESGSTARTSLGVAIGSDVQAYDAELAAVAGLTSAADKGIQFTGDGTAATYDLTSAGKALLDDANAAAQLITLGLTATASEINLVDDGISINELSDAKSGGTDFSNSILIGQSPTATLDDAQYNVGLGYGVFEVLTSGDRNMGLGYNALNRLTTGTGNVGIGAQSLTGLTVGARNVAIGRQSGRDVPCDACTDGLDGLSGGADLTTGDENTYIGAWTQPSANDATNETVIGAESTGQGSNTVTIGNASVTQVYLSQDKGATVYAGSLDVTASGGITLQNDETITNSTDGTVVITATTTSVSGDLTVTGNDVTFGNGESISNSTDGTVAITATNTTVSGNLSGSGTISGFDANLNDQTGAYTLASSDNGKVVTINSASAVTLTIDANLGDGFNCLVVQKGSGQVTIAAATGVSVVNRSSETKTANQYAVVSIINIGNNGSNDIYILSGDTGN